MTALVKGHGTQTKPLTPVYPLQGRQGPGSEL